MNHLINMMKKATVLFLSFLAAACNVFSQVPTFTKDINTNYQSSSPSALASASASASAPRYRCSAARMFARCDAATSLSAAHSRPAASSSSVDVHVQRVVVAGGTAVQSQCQA